MPYNMFRIPLLVVLVVLMVLDLSGVIQVPAIFIILIIIGLLWYNIHIRKKAAQGDYPAKGKK